MFFSLEPPCISTEPAFNLKIKKNALVTLPSIHYPARSLPPASLVFERTGKFSKHSSTSVDTMVSYYHAIDPHSYIPLEILYENLTQGLETEWNEYTDDPLSGNPLHIFNNRNNKFMAARSGEAMNCLGISELKNRAL